MPRTSRLLLAFLLVATTMAVGQIRHDVAKAVDASDEIHSLLLAHQEEIARRYERGGTIVPQFKPWVQVDSAATRQLFPRLRFASIEWDEAADPRAKDRFVNRAFGLQTTLAVDMDACSVVATLDGYGNYEAFGALLAEQKILLRNEADANVIWDAFCDLHHKHWKNQPHAQISDTEWRLGHYRSDDCIASDGTFRTVVTRTYYTRVWTDPDTNRVLSSKLVVDTSNERRIPLNPQ